MTQLDLARSWRDGAEMNAALGHLAVAEVMSAVAAEHERHVATIDTLLDLLVDTAAS